MNTQEKIDNQTPVVSDNMSEQFDKLEATLESFALKAEDLTEESVEIWSEFMKKLDKRFYEIYNETVKLT